MDIQSFCYLPHEGFEGRNQEYGAYVLRSKYSEIVTRVLIFVIIGSVFVFGYPTIKRLLEPEEEVVLQKQVEEEVTQEIPLELEQPQEPEEQKKAEVVIEVPPPPEIDQTKFTVIEIKEEVKEQKPLVENVEVEQKETAVASETKQGEAASNVVEEVKVVEEPGKDLKEAGTGEEDANKVYNEFEVVKNADYPGGINAFRKALQEKIKYPSQATRKGTEGTVTISFVIDKDGRITDAKIVKDIGDGCGDAALEALKQMTTPWSPATDAKGKTVKVRRTLPVKFTLPK